MEPTYITDFHRVDFRKWQLYYKGSGSLCLLKIISSVHGLKALHFMEALTFSIIPCELIMYYQPNTRQGSRRIKEKQKAKSGTEKVAGT